MFYHFLSIFCFEKERGGGRGERGEGREERGEGRGSGEGRG